MSRTERQPGEGRAPGSRAARARGWRRGALVFALGLATSLVAAGPAGLARAASGDCTTTGVTTTCTYTYTGAAQTWTVPAGITSATFDVFGAQGGGGGTGNDAIYSTGGGGLGGEATATLTVIPGEMYQLNVGGVGVAGSSASGAAGGAGGFNSGAQGGSGDSYSGGSGGGGGGASDVRTASGGLTDRLLVAGGGGGGGGAGGGGGGGGGYYGGGGGGAAPLGTAGGSGTQTGGGSGGGSTNGCGAGGIGSSGVGGVGGQGNQPFPISCSGSPDGGGGQGGGSTGGNGASGTGGSGGGGGSGFGPAGVVFHSGVQSGNGQVVITYGSSADTTAPTTTISLSPASPNGQNGWYTSPPTVSIAATDPDDTGGIQTRCVLDPASVPGSFADLPATACAYMGAGTSVSQDGIHAVYAASEDPAGNVEAPIRSASFKLDQTAPTITASATKADGTAYTAGTWTNQTVTAHFTCADALSGVASCPADQVFSTDGVTQAAGGTATDNAGNQASAGFGPIQVDKTPPVVSVTGVSNGASYTLGSVPTAGCTTTDALSGVATAAVLQLSGGTANGVGTFTATCAGAQDKAGNSASASATYTVEYAFSGYLAPVNNAPTVNTGKAGRTYPLKFQLTDASGGFISSLSAVTSVSYKVTGCGAFTGDPTDALEANATGGTSLRYDSTANQYVYNWATPGAGCYTLFLTLDSGQVFPAYFNLR